MTVKLIVGVATTAAIIMAVLAIYNVLVVEQRAVRRRIPNDWNINPIYIRP